MIEGHQVGGGCDDVPAKAGDDPTSQTVTDHT